MLQYLIDCITSHLLSLHFCFLLFILLITCYIVLCIVCFSEHVSFQHLLLVFVIAPSCLFDLFVLLSLYASMCSLCTFPPAPIIHCMSAPFVLISDNPFIVSTNKLNFNHPLSLLNQATMADFPVKGCFLFLFSVCSRMTATLL